MTNPLDTIERPTSRVAQPGDMLTITTKDGKMVNITRTSRPYAEDLADAYNAAMEPSARARGCEWFVAPNGELKLGYSDQSMRDNAKRMRRQQETERARHLRRQFNAAQSPSPGGAPHG